MADLDVLQRSSLTWLWWVLGVLAAGGLLWLATSLLPGGPRPGEESPEELQRLETTAMTTRSPAPVRGARDLAMGRLGLEPRT